GVGEGYRRARGFDGFAHAERALRLLRAVKEEVGVNCVVSRSSFDGLTDVARLVRRLRLNELELLRFKPVGRGARLGEELTPDQGRRIYPLARRLVPLIRPQRAGAVRQLRVPAPVPRWLPRGRGGAWSVLRSRPGMPPGAGMDRPDRWAGPGRRGWLLRASGGARVTVLFEGTAR